MPSSKTSKEASSPKGKKQPQEDVLVEISSGEDEEHYDDEQVRSSEEAEQSDQEDNEDDDEEEEQSDEEEEEEEEEVKPSPKVKSSVSKRPQAEAPQPTYQPDPGIISSQDIPTAGSLHSTVVSSTTSKYPTAREVSETASGTLYETRWCIISLIVNSLILYYVTAMDEGVVMFLPVETLKSFAAVVFTIILILANIVTFWALNSAAEAYFGYRLCSKGGYSMAVHGFLQASALGKLDFTNVLSLNSPCRKLLSRLGLIWVIMSIMLILAPISATALYKKDLRGDFGYVNCIEYYQDGEPVDRHWPTTDIASGVSELLFGKSLGYLRAVMDVDSTYFIMHPQLIGDVLHGETIAGHGFVASIHVYCECTATPDVQGVMEVAPTLNATEAQELLSVYMNMTDRAGMANIIQKLPEEIKVTSILSSVSVCGGAEPNRFLPVCRTRLYDHKDATVIVTYMTDGSPKSIVPYDSDVRKYNGKAKQNWMAYAFDHILGGRVTQKYLHQTVPSMLNPIMWWATSNRLAVDPAMLERGMEALWAVTLRAAMQRSYSVRGSNCIKNIAFETESILKMQPYGVLIGQILLAVQIAVSVASFAAFLPWFISNSPIGPAVRFCRDSIYYATLVNSSTLQTGFETCCNAPSHTIWQALDQVIRLGESVQTVTEDVGHIMIDKPKLIRDMKNGKKYY